MVPPVLTTPEEFQTLLDKYDTFLCDCDGVIYHGPVVVPGVPDVLKHLRANGKVLSFVVLTRKASESSSSRTTLPNPDGSTRPLSMRWTLRLLSYVIRLTLSVDVLGRHLWLRLRVCSLYLTDSEASQGQEGLRYRRKWHRRGASRRWHSVHRWYCKFCNRLTLTIVGPS
jgi:hypothetical protein